MGWLTGACSVVLTGFAIAAVPTGEKVPVHYGVDMQPNRWGSPVELLLLPIVMLACIALLALVLHLVSPEHWNQPAGLESDEKDAWYLVVRRLQGDDCRRCCIRTIAYCNAPYIHCKVSQEQR